MARYTGPKCRQCRRAGEKLYLKGPRCETAKCAVAKRDVPPGPRTWRRGRPSDYSRRLREKQKLKQHYGVLERQFRRYFAKAARSKGNTGKTLLVELERRLDSVVYRLGIARSRSEARMLVGHGHIRVNGRKVTIPSAPVGPGDEITVTERDEIRSSVKESVEVSRWRQVPSWLALDEQSLTGRVLEMPKREELLVPIQEQLIVELCSR
jgi:small subunit ribosomal protein S4